MNASFLERRNLCTYYYLQHICFSLITQNAQVNICILEGADDVSLWGKPESLGKPSRSWMGDLPHVDIGNRTRTIAVTSERNTIALSGFNQFVFNVFARHAVLYVKDSFPPTVIRNGSYILKFSPSKIFFQIPKPDKKHF